MAKYIYSSAITLLLLGAVFVPSVNAETTTSTTTVATTSTTSIDAMLAQIKVLMARVAELKAQLGLINSEIKTTLKDGLSEGMSNDDIRKVQELLATDPTIYPEGKVTGFYGKLTTEAMKRFQIRHGLAMTGMMDAETKTLLEEYLHEGFGDKIPAGLLRAPGIMKKVEDRFSQGCEKQGMGMGPLCKKMKEHMDDGKGPKDTEDDDMHGDNNATTSFDVVIAVVNGTTTVSFTSSSTDYEVVVHSTNLDVILAAVAQELGISVRKINSELKSDIKDTLKKVLNTTDSVAKVSATTAINNTQDAIDEAETAIDAATGSTTDADNLLADAQDKLDDAENAFDDKEYTNAKTLAIEAKNLAKDAVDAL